MRPVFGRRVPRIDRRVVLDARVGAAPSGIGDPRSSSSASPVSTTAPSGRALTLAAGLGGLHERVGDAHRVGFAFLVLDRAPVGRVQRHVVAGRLEHRPGLLLAAPCTSELLDVGVIDVQDDHLGRAPRLPPDLIVPADASAPRMNENWPARVARPWRLLLGGAQAQRSRPARAAAEDDALAADPVEDVFSIESSIQRTNRPSTCAFSSKPTLNETGLLKERRAGRQGSP